MQQILSTIRQAILDGKAKLVAQMVREALESGIEPQVILRGGMIAAMEEIGRQFETGEVFVPELLISARAMKEGLAVLRPHLVAASVQPVGRVVSGTVKGDIHDIGKNLVAIMLEGAGFEIRDLGVDVGPEKFVEAVRAGGVDIVAISALLTTTMPNMRDTIEALQDAGLRDKVKVIVGGAPLTAEFARQIGADGFAPDANQAVILARSLVGA